MELFEHQRAGVDWLLAHPKGGLFDEQGLGKTATAIVAAVTASRNVAQRRGVLVIVPTVVLYNWKREIEQWAPGSSVRMITSGKDRVATTGPREDFVIVTHGLLLSPGVYVDLSTRKWDTIIVDEAHAFKNPKAKRTDALYGLKRGSRGLVNQAERVWLLTGTPMPNNPSELWPHLHALAPERIRAPFNPAIEFEPRPMRFIEFRRHYCKLAPSDYGDGWKIVGAQNTQELREHMRGFGLRRRLLEVMDLPPIFFGTMTITGAPSKELLDIERSLNVRRPTDTMRDAGVSGFKVGSRHISLDSIDQTMGSNVLEQLRDAVEFSTWRRLCGLAKVAPSVELLTEFLEDNPHEKIVVFAHHAEVIQGLNEGLSQFGVATITGATEPWMRTHYVNEFQTSEKPRVAICNLIAGGVGITLTAANRVFFVEQSFVPGDNAQAASRCHRIGQKHPVLVRNLALAGSLDELLVEILTRKTEMIREVIK